MANQPEPNLVAVLTALLQDWVDSAFPRQVGRSSLARDVSDVANLEEMWSCLADALCGPRADKRSLFTRELLNLHFSPRVGDPPREALTARLLELQDAGLREPFLVLAIRQALSDLIARTVPKAASRWHQLADERLPLILQFAYRDDEMPGPGSTLKPLS